MSIIFCIFTKNINKIMFTTKCNEFVTYNDKLYQVYRKVNKSMIKEGHITDVRDLWHCDVVLKNKEQQSDDDTLIFLIEVSEATIIED